MFTLVRVVILVWRLIIRHYDNPSEPTMLRDAYGNVVAVDGRILSKPGRMFGPGSKTSEPLVLSIGLYRIDYDFPSPARLALLEGETDKTLLKKQGKGITYLTISQPGNYRLRVELENEERNWQLFYRQIGREGQSE
jgi:hypothetical protein